MSGSPPGEDLAEAARLAREQAPALCHRAPGASESCAWNHGLWPTLRQLGVVSEPALHGAFLRSALAGVDGDRPRVLLSGVADHALLAQALAAFAGREPQVTVLDLCETPLMLNRWYAARVGASIETLRANILEYDGRARFDVICTHLFLSHFDDQRRAELIRRWHDLLAPGGRLVTVNRLRPGRERQWIGLSVDQVWALRARIEDAARSAGILVPGLGRAAEAYASRLSVFPLESEEELRALFTRGGFHVERIELATVPASEASAVSLPTVPSRDPFAQMIAIRR